SLCGSDEQRERWLRPLAGGERRGTPALLDAGSPAPPGGVGMEAKADGDGGGLAGGKGLGVDAPHAAFFLLAPPARRRPVVAAGAEGVRVPPEQSIDLTRRLSSVRFDGVKVAAADTLPGEAADYFPVFFRVCVALAAESTGVAQRALEMAIEYAKDRQQFG